MCRSTYEEKHMIKEEEVEKAAEIIQTYLKENDLNSPYFSLHVDVFWRELNTYMTIKRKEGRDA